MRLQHLPLICFLVLAATTPAEDLRMAAQAQETAYAKAMKTKNIAWLEKVTAPDFYAIESSGKKISRAQAMQQLKMIVSLGAIKALNFKILDVRPKGNGMIIRIESHTVATFPAPGGKNVSTLVDDNLGEEMWSKDHGKWRIHSIKTISDKSTLDGKPMPTGA